MIMFAFVEVPIVAYLFARKRTITAVDDFNDWLGRNGRRLGVDILAVVGTNLTAAASSSSSADMRRGVSGNRSCA